MSSPLPPPLSLRLPRRGVESRAARRRSAGSDQQRPAASAKPRLSPPNRDPSGRHPTANSCDRAQAQVPCRAVPCRAEGDQHPDLASGLASPRHFRTPLAPWVIECHPLTEPRDSPSTGPGPRGRVLRTAVSYLQRPSSTLSYLHTGLSYLRRPCF